ncbi:MAG: radical SAM protein, partial [Pseudomonadota bacterium]
MESKRELLSELKKIPGIILPGLVPDFSPACQELDEVFPSAPLIPYLPDNEGVGLVEISKGCRAFCSFCAENWGHKPYQERSIKNLLASATELKIRTGATKIELSSYNFNMYQEFLALLEGLAPLFADIGLKSQRFDRLAEDPRALQYLAILGKTSLSCGLEGISQRLRVYLNKGLDQQQLQKSM